MTNLADIDWARKFIAQAEGIAETHGSDFGSFVYQGLTAKLHEIREEARGLGYESATVQAMAACSRHIVWASEPGRMTPEELRLIAGACNAVRSDISALRTASATTQEKK